MSTVYLSMHEELCKYLKPSSWSVAGVAKVVKNGPGSFKFSEGQRVVAVQWPQFQAQGTWQQFVVVKEETLVSLDSCSRHSFEHDQRWGLLAHYSLAPPTMCQWHATSTAMPNNAFTQ